MVINHDHRCRNYVRDVSDIMYSEVRNVCSGYVLSQIYDAFYFVPLCCTVADDIIYKIEREDK